MRKGATERSGQKRKGTKSVRPDNTGIYRWPQVLTFWMLTKKCRVERNALNAARCLKEKKKKISPKNSLVVNWRRGGQRDLSLLAGVSISQL